MSSVTSETAESPARPHEAGDKTDTVTKGALPNIMPNLGPTSLHVDRDHSDGRSVGAAQEIKVSTEQEKSGSPWLLLGQRNFRLYFFGALVSNLGTWLQSTAQVIIAYQITHSVFFVGLIASAQFAGMIFSPWSAVLANRIGTRRFLVGTQSASAAIALLMAGLYYTGLLGEHALVFSALALGLAFALALPVQTALLPVLVNSEDATGAVKMNSVSYNAGRALAPALCVLVIAFLGPGPIFVLNAASFIFFAGCLARILGRLDNQKQKNLSADHEKDSEASEHPRVTDGFRTALEHRRILLLLAIVAAVTFADDPIFVLSPALVHARLQLSSQWTGYFIAALGWGSVFGSLPPTSKSGTARRASRHAALGLIILSISVIVFTIGASAEISLIAAGVAGAAGLYTGAAAQTALLRHRKQKAFVTVASVAALWAIAWAGTKPIASLLDGWLGAHWGIVPAAAVLTAPALLIAFGETAVPLWLKKRINAWAERIIEYIGARWLLLVAWWRSRAVLAVPAVATETHVTDEISQIPCDSCGKSGTLQPSRAPTSYQPV